MCRFRPLPERKDLKEYPDNQGSKECLDRRDHRGRKAYQVRRDRQGG